LAALFDPFWGSLSVLSAFQSRVPRARPLHVRALARACVTASACLGGLAITAATFVACARGGGPAPAASSSGSRLHETSPTAAAPANTTPVETDTYLGSFTAAAVRAAVRDRLGPTDVATRWHIAEWKARPGSIVALSFQAVPFGANVDELRPAVVVLENRSGKLVPIADGKLALGQVHCENGSGESVSDEAAPVFELDLAPYVIAPGATAIGVRFVCYNTFPAGEGSLTQLSLLELHAGTLREVLREPVSFSNHDRPSGTEIDTRGTVSLDTTLHDGHFDLVIQTTRRIADDGSGIRLPADRASPKVETRRYVWSSDRYIPLQRP